MQSPALTRRSHDAQQHTPHPGPSHPTTHGTLRIVLELQGETITKATPEMGYLHRGVEKLGENLSYQQFIPLTDRLNYCSSIMNNVGYTTAVEKLLGIEIPKRAQQIRVLVSELARIADHLVCVGVNAVDIGAFTAFLYLFRQRETIYDLFEMAAGQRLHTSFTRIGGLFRDIPEGFVPLTERFLVECEASLKELEDPRSQNHHRHDPTTGLRAGPSRCQQPLAHAGKIYSCCDVSAARCGVHNRSISLLISCLLLSAGGCHCCLPPCCCCCCSWHATTLLLRCLLCCLLRSLLCLLWLQLLIAQFIHCIVL